MIKRLKLFERQSVCFQRRQLFDISQTASPDALYRKYCTYRTLHGTGPCYIRITLSVSQHGVVYDTDCVEGERCTVHTAYVPYSDGDSQ